MNVDFNKPMNRVGRAIIFLLPLILLISLSIHLSGDFVYTLDDPYIHLDLAKNAWGGLYGINTGEPAAPSSSILWPFLLEPFTDFSFFEWTPLLINTVCVAVFADWMVGFLGGFLRPHWAWLATLLALLSLNVYGLAMTGMEHSLQLLLVLAIVLNLAAGKHGFVFLAAAVALPWIRYEGVAISLPVLLYVGLRHDRRAWLAIVVMLAGLALFSWFLHGLNLGWLPSSVMAKSSSMAGGHSLVAFVQGLLENVADNLTHPPTPFFVILAAAGFWLAIQKHEWVRGLFLYAMPVALHLCFGRNGWFGRYEVYIVLYVLILAVSESRGFFKTHPYRCIGVAFVGMVACAPLLICTLKTPWASRNVHDQQWQMAVISSHYLKDNVAVNDLGLVALRTPHYVLDLWGLGSLEALKARKRDPSGAWIRPLMDAKHVKYAMVYDEWFKQRPANWRRVASLVLPGRRVTSAGGVVALYATDDPSAQSMRVALSRYQLEHPEEGKMLQLAP
jgi:hypothetical protein